MTTKEFIIAKHIYFKTAQTRFCTLAWKEIKQGKRFYHRVKEMELKGYIQVFRENGERSLYRLTDVGLKLLLDKNPLYV